jgi:hypothetical protein
MWLDKKRTPSTPGELLATEAVGYRLLAVASVLAPATHVTKISLAVSRAKLTHLIRGHQTLLQFASAGIAE